jgi:hypothetical protein
MGSSPAVLGAATRGSFGAMLFAAVEAFLVALRVVVATSPAVSLA